MIKPATLLMIILLAGRTVAEDGFRPLFPDDGIPLDWAVRLWSDVSKPAPEGAQWVVEEGVLNGGGARGSWLGSRT